MDKVDLKLAARYGLIVGAILSIISLISYVFSDQLFSGFWSQTFIGIGIMALTIFLIVWFGISYRKGRGGSIRFPEAFLAVFTIFAISMALNFVTSYLINSVIDTEYQTHITERMKRNVSDFMEKSGSTDEQIEERMKQFDGSEKAGAIDLLIGYGKTLLAGALFSLIIALFIKRNPDSVVAPPPAE